MKKSELKELLREEVAKNIELEKLVAELEAKLATLEG